MAVIDFSDPRAPNQLGFVRVQPAMRDLFVTPLGLRDFVVATGDCSRPSRPLR